MFSPCARLQQPGQPLEDDCLRMLAGDLTRAGSSARSHSGSVRLHGRIGGIRRGTVKHGLRYAGLDSQETGWALRPL